CTQITREACPLNLAPTASTTAQLAMGDALAVCVLELRNFSPNDFARFHPGGNLGKRLYLRVADICALNLTPNVLPTAPLHEVLLAISAGRLGAVAVGLPQPTQLVVIGIITDGDLRRAMLNKGQNWLSLTASDVMSHKPVTVLNTDLAINAHELIRQHKISQVVALNEQGYYAGMVHIHDLVREGIV
nr:CBS domain-containing protein [Chitinophagales bacterium]